MNQVLIEARRVLYFSRVWGSRDGGSFYSKRLIEELLDRGWEITVLSERFEQACVNGAHMRAFFKSEVRTWPQKMRELVSLLRIIRGSGQALIIVQGDLPRVSYLLLQLITPVVFIRQDGILTCPSSNRLLPMCLSICERPAGFSCIRASQTKGCFRGLSPVRRIGRLCYRMRDRVLLSGFRHLVVNSFYLSRIHRRASHLLYPPRGRDGALTLERPRNLNRLVFCGRLDPVKGCSHALEILKLLPSEYRLDVLGDGSERNNLARFAHESNLGARVFFHGWVDHATRDTVLLQAAVLLMPSLWDEAFGMVGLEAFVLGTPVVAYDVGGISEWCRADAGIIVPCGDFREAASAVRRLTQNRVLWDKASSEARSVAHNIFPYRRFGQELDALLAKVLAGKRRLINGREI